MAVTLARPKAWARDACIAPCYLMQCTSFIVQARASTFFWHIVCASCLFFARAGKRPALDALTTLVSRAAAGKKLALMHAATINPEAGDKKEAGAPSEKNSCAGQPESTRPTMRLPR